MADPRAPLFRWPPLLACSEDVAGVRGMNGLTTGRCRPGADLSRASLDQLSQFLASARSLTTRGQWLKIAALVAKTPPWPFPRR